MSVTVDASSVKRIEIIRTINQRLDQHCAGCVTRKALIEEGFEYQKKSDNVVDRHCSKHCPIGAELQCLGKQLGASDPLYPDDVIIHRRFSPTTNRKVRTR